MLYYSRAVLPVEHEDKGESQHDHDQDQHQPEHGHLRGRDICGDLDNICV